MEEVYNKILTENHRIYNVLVDGFDLLVYKNEELVYRFENYNFENFSKTWTEDELFMYKEHEKMIDLKEKRKALGVINMSIFEDYEDYDVEDLSNFWTEEELKLYMEYHEKK